MKSIIALEPSKAKEPKIRRSFKKDFVKTPTLIQVLNKGDHENRAFVIRDVENLHKGEFRIDPLHVKYARKLGPIHVLVDTNVGQCVFNLEEHKFYMEIGSDDGPKLILTYPMYYFSCVGFI